MVRMDISKLLGSFLNRVIIYFLIEAFIQVIVAMFEASSSAGIVVGAVAIGAFVVLELLHWANMFKPQG